jgi:hypothetical protein
MGGLTSHPAFLLHLVIEEELLRNNKMPRDQLRKYKFALTFRGGATGALSGLVKI